MTKRERLAVLTNRGSGSVPIAAVLSVVLHLALLALVLPWLLTPIEQRAAESEIPVEVVLLESPVQAPEPLAAETPEPEPELAEAAVAPPPEPEPTAEAEPEQAEAPPVALEEPAPEPEIAEAVEPEPEPEVAEEPEVVDEPEVADEPEPAEEPAPEPVVAEAPVPEPAPAPESEAAPAEVPEAVVEAVEPPAAEEAPVVEELPPVPDRRPLEPAPEPLLAESPEPPAEQPEPVEAAAEEPAAEEPTIETALQAEPEPAKPPAPSGLTRPTTPEGLLANLAALADEDLQAKAKPELWEVIRAVRAQIKRCWLLNPAEERNPQLSVQIAVAFDRGGTLLKAEVLDVARMVQDEEFKAFAVTAHRALKSCSPFQLPADRYDIWSAFTLRFVPHEPS